MWQVCKWDSPSSPGFVVIIVVCIMNYWTKIVKFIFFIMCSHWSSSSISVLFSSWLDTDFLKCLQSKSSPSLFRWSLCECFQHTARQSTTLPYHSLSLCRTWRSARGLRSSQGFPEHAHNPGHLCGLVDSQKHIGASQSPLSQLFFLMFWLICCFPQLLLITPGSGD